MNAEPKVDPLLGRVDVAFAEPFGPNGIMAVVGALVFATGAGILPLAIGSLLWRHRGQNPADVIAGFVVGLGCFSGGLTLLVASLRARYRKAAWYVCEHGMAKVGRSGELRRVLWHDVTDAAVSRAYNGRNMLEVQLRLERAVSSDSNVRASEMFYVPDERIAERACILWARATGRSADREEGRVV